MEHRKEQPAKVIGVGGLIGSGKSTVTRCLQVWGYPLFDCDSVAKQLYYTPAMRAELQEQLGLDPIAPDGSLLKAELSHLLTKAETKERLERLVFAGVERELHTWQQCQEASGQSLLWVESAILFSSGFASLCHLTMAVEAPKKVRLSRVMRRDNTVDTQRFDHFTFLQAGEERLLSQAHYTLLNDNRHSVILQLETFLSDIKKR